MSVRVVVDRDKCQGHGMCEIHAPEAFFLDPETNVAEVVAAGAARASRETLEVAAQMCPVHAITIVTDEEE